MDFAFLMDAYSLRRASCSSAVSGSLAVGFDLATDLLVNTVVPIVPAVMPFKMVRRSNWLFRSITNE